METIEELEKIYDLELDKVIFEIKKKKANLVLLQFPDGLKPYATSVVDYLEEKLNSSERKNKVGFLIWLGSCFGACDTPVGIEKLCTASHRDDLRKQRPRCVSNCGMKGQIDLVVQFGHNSLMPDY